MTAQVDQRAVILEMANGSLKQLAGHQQVKHEDELDITGLKYGNIIHFKMTSSSILASLTGSTTSEERLRLLKDLKNSVIGNTWRKVEIVQDEALLN